MIGLPNSLPSPGSSRAGSPASSSVAPFGTLACGMRVDNLRSMKEGSSGFLGEQGVPKAATIQNRPRNGVVVPDLDLLLPGSIHNLLHNQSNHRSPPCVLVAEEIPTYDKLRLWTGGRGATGAVALWAI